MVNINVIPNTAFKFVTDRFVLMPEWLNFISNVFTALKGRWGKYGASVSQSGFVSTNTIDVRWSGGVVNGIIDCSVDSYTGPSYTMTLSVGEELANGTANVIATDSMGDSSGLVVPIVLGVINLENAFAYSPESLLIQFNLMRATALN